ncbi:DoxX family membrane protein [Gordonia jinghuaiqii]|uniref:DoxX family protein n=1 Tax=Gordonia jinghuaiqii TaxID=2758710 RepID=A0A7D7LTP1_9ACTN|nr:DoxX family protein [Gordonia jinghuaiqii]MCR5977036.1 DoxX family membrane protein [Gordonia jinghuaiqii]QMT00355.1 DoxX family protein [Gordonia jinghuaiqii]
MSERDTSGRSERDTFGAGATSPYDEPTGQIEVPGPAAGTPGGPDAQVPPAPAPPPVADRDDFYTRHARRSPAPYSRVDDLDDLDPGDVETRQVHGAGNRVPPAQVPTPAAGAPAPAPSAPNPPAPNPPAPNPTDDFETVEFARTPTPTSTGPADDTVTTPEPALPPVGTSRYDFLDDEDDLAGTSTRGARSSDTALLDDAPPADDAGRTRRRFGRRRRDDLDDARSSAADEDLEDALAKSRRGTIDLGLLLLRVALGAVVGAHGLQKLFGLWNGPRLGGFESMLVDGGFNADYAQILAIVGALSETVGGLMVILGLLTPIGASAILGTMLVAAAYKISAAGGFTFFAAAGGVEFELFLAVAAAVVILTGPGLYSLDYPRGWARRPFVGSFLWLIVGAAAAVAVWILANGTNPLN